VPLSRPPSSPLLTQSCLPSRFRQVFHHYFCFLNAHSILNPFSDLFCFPCQLDELKTSLGGQATKLERELQTKTRALQEATQELTDTKSLLEQQEGMLHLRTEELSQERQANQRLGVEFGELQTDNQQLHLHSDQLRQEKESLELNMELSRTNLQVLEKELEDTGLKIVGFHHSPPSSSFSSNTKSPTKKIKKRELQGLREEIQRLEADLTEKEALIEDFKMKESQFKNLNKAGEQLR